jgi:surface antigen
MKGIRLVFEIIILALTLCGSALGQQSITGTYVKEDQVTTLVFSPNGTFSLNSTGTDVSGRYELKGANLTIKFGFGGLPRKASFIVVGEDKLVDKEGKQYFRRNPPQELPTDARPVLHSRDSLNSLAGTPNAGFTNADVIQLARSGVPDSVIIQKIRSCNCVLDTSTQALIQLQQAGVSASVMGVMAGGSGGPETAKSLGCTASPASFEKEPQTHSPCYTTENHYYLAGYGGQCTWFALGRALEKGFSLPFKMEKGEPWHGDAADWIDHLNLRNGVEPRANSLAVWSRNGELAHGHVAYVETIQDGYVYFREANIKPCFKDSKEGGGYCGDLGPDRPGLKKREVSWLRSRFGGDQLKFIYLADLQGTGSPTPRVNAQPTPATQKPATQVSATPTPAANPIDARTAAQAFIDAHLTQCGASTYFNDLMGPMIPLGVRELRGFSWNVVQSPVTNADQLNGISGKAVLRLTAQANRLFSNSSQSWSQWRDGWGSGEAEGFMLPAEGRRGPSMQMVRQNGQWQIEALGLGSAQRGTCDSFMALGR